VNSSNRAAMELAREVGNHARSPAGIPGTSRRARCFAARNPAVLDP
jgi:hypothetical protein